jgi:hypothetical protein
MHGTTNLKHLKLCILLGRNSKNRPWLRHLIADLSLRRPKFDPESIHETFLANWHRDKALLRAPRFSPGITRPPLLYTHLDLKTTLYQEKWENSENLH